MKLTQVVCKDVKKQPENVFAVQQHWQQVSPKVHRLCHGFKLANQDYLLFEIVIKTNIFDCWNKKCEWKYVFKFIKFFLSNIALQ